LREALKEAPPTCGAWELRAKGWFENFEILNFELYAPQNALFYL
jgi:hypothetical protein